VTELRRPHVVLGSLWFASIVYSFQQNMVITALPTLKQDLHASTTWITWIATGTMLMSVVATPIIGKLADQYGKRRMMLVSLGVLLAASIGATAADSLWGVILCRTVIGVGGAAPALAIAIVGDEFPPERVGTAIGVLSASFPVGGTAGMALSGLIIDLLSWRALFAIVAVAVAVAVVLVVAFVPATPGTRRTRIDVWGAVLLSTSLTSLLLALTQAPAWGWTSPGTLGLFALAAVTLAVFVLVELRVDEPMVDIRVFARRTVLLTNTLTLFAGAAMIGTWVTLPAFVSTPHGLPAPIAALTDYGFDASPTQVGLFLMPAASVGVFSGVLAGRFGRRHGYKWAVVWGMLAVAGGLAIVASWHDRPWHFVLGLVAFGLGVPFALAAVAVLVVESVDPRDRGIASSLNTVSRQVGGATGGQIAAAVIGSHTIRNTSVPSETGFVVAFWLGCAAAVTSALIALLVTPRRSERRFEVPAAVDSRA
jgi:MFS family permease